MISQPRTWNEIEQSPEYQGMSTVQRRALFTEWDGYARQYAQENGMWDNADFQKDYEKKSKDTLLSFAPPSVRAWQAVHDSAPVNLIRNAANSIYGGWLEGGRANEIQFRNDPAAVADYSREIAKYQPTEDYNTAWDESKPAAESWAAFKKDPIGNLTQLLSRSFASQIRTTIPQLGKIPERIAQTVGALGVATGVGAALSGPGAPAVTSAGVAGLPVAVAGGMQWGYAEATAAASHANEFASQFIETLQENGVDVTDKDSLAKAYKNTDLMQKVRSEAQQKGVPVAAWDGLSAAIAGHVFNKATGGKGLIKALKIAGKWLGEVGVQGLMGMAGEAQSQIATKGEIYAPKAVFAEGLAEFAQGAVDVGVGAASKVISSQSPAHQAKVEALKQTSQNLADNNAPITAQVMAKEGAETLAKQGAESDETLINDLMDEEELGAEDLTDKTLGDERFAPATKAVMEANKLEESPIPETLMAGSTAEQLFSKIEAGDLTVNGKGQKMLAEAYLAYMNGEFKNATEMDKWINAKVNPERYEATIKGPAAEAKTEQKSEEPKKTQSFTFERGQNVIIDGKQAGVVNTVREDGNIIVKIQDVGKTIFRAINPLQNKVEVITGVKASEEAKISPNENVTTTTTPITEPQRSTLETTKTGTDTTTEPTVTEPAAGEAGPVADQTGVSESVGTIEEPSTGTKAVPQAQSKLAELEKTAAEAKTALEAIGPEPHKPSNEKRFFGSKGREAADPAIVARYDAEVKAYNKWKRQYAKLKKAEVETSNAAFYERQKQEKATAAVKNPTIEKRVERAAPNRRAKVQRALTVDQDADPYIGPKLTNEKPDTVEQAAANLDELEEIGALDDDASGRSVIQNIANSKKQPAWVRSVASAILKSSNDNLVIDAVYRPDSTWAGLYDSYHNFGRILINTARTKGMEMTHVILHEAAHHITLKKIIGNAELNETEQQAIANLQEVFNQLQKFPEVSEAYGLSSLQEFVAEAFSNAGFRESLNNIYVGSISMWDRFVNAVSRLFYGQSVARGSALEFAMRNALDLAGASVVENTQAAFGGALHTIAEAAWRHGYNRDQQSFNQLVAKYPQMRNELNQAFGLGSRKTRELAALAPEDQTFAENGGMLVAPLRLDPSKTPQKTIKAYKLFDVRKDGKLYPLFIQKKNQVEGKKQSVPEPIEVGVWLEAENLPTKKFQSRPGWHSGILPAAPHLRTKENLKAENRVWAEVEVSADVDWQPIANASKKKDIRDRIPAGGFYQFSVSRQLGGGWIVSGAIKVNRLLSNEDLAQILTEGGRPEDVGPETLNGSAVTPASVQALFNKNASLEARTFAVAKLMQDVAPLAPVTQAEVKELTPEQSQLLVDHLDLASRIANNFRNIPLTGYDERQSEARLGLIKAAQAYDPAKNDNFRNYAVRIIKNTLTDLLRKKIRQSKREVSVNIPINGEEGGTETFQDILTGPEETPTPDQGAIEIINKIRDSLSKRDQKILNDFATGMPLREVADINGLSHEGVRKIIRKAGTQILAGLETAGITDINNIFPPVEGRKQASAATVFSPEDEEADTSEIVGQIEAADVKSNEAILKDAIIESDNGDGTYDFSNAHITSPLPAYHGTPHKVNKFSLSKIGTGEGAQVYGWGLYFAQNRKVAEDYQRRLGENDNPVDLQRSIQYLIDKGISDDPLEDYGYIRDQDYIALASEYGFKPEHTGKLYAVDLNVKDSELLDWDKPTNLDEFIGRMPDGNLKKMFTEETQYVADRNPSGSWIYETIKQLHGFNPELASKYLLEIGIPGIRYLDQGSRRAYNFIVRLQDDEKTSATEFKTPREAEAFAIKIRKEFPRGRVTVTDESSRGTYNYVIFDESKIQILEENGKPIGTMADAQQHLVAPLSPEGQKTKVPWGIRKQTGPYKPVGKLFSAAGRWNKELYAALKIKTQKARAALTESVFLDRRLQDLYKKYYKDQPIPRETINTALGTIENTYTDAQWKAAQKIEDPADKASFLLTAKLDNFADFRARQAAALASLPDEIQDVVIEMRNERNKLQNELRNSGAINDELAYSIDDSNDLYIHRSYGIFDDPDGKWVDYVLHSDDAEAAQIRNRAEALFSAKARAEEANRYMRDMRAAGTPVNRATALMYVQGLDVSDRVNELFTEYTEVADGDVTEIMRGRLPGQKNLSIIKLRGQIPAEIRALWGEYKDPSINFAKTYGSLAHFLANDEFLNTVLEDGINNGYIWKKEFGGTRPEGFVKIIGANAKSMKPLEGVYGPPMLRDAFGELNDTFQKDWLSTLTLLAMKAKTVYSLQAVIRNLLGNPAFIIANGNLFRGNLFDSFKVAWTNFRKSGPAARRAYVVRLIELGVLGDNVGPEILKDLEEHAKNFVDPDKIKNKLLASAAKNLDKIQRFAEGVYSGVDDVWKVYAFEAERSKLEKAMPGASIDEIDQIAATTVRRTMPTYSEAFKASTDLFRGSLGKLVAPYITFTTEVMRVTGGTIGQINEELNSSNPEIRKIGAGRIAGVMAMIVGSIALQKALKAAFEYDDEDEEAIRRGLPIWQQNAQIAFIPRSADGKPRLVDLSYVNPYNYFSDPVTAIMRAFGQGKPFGEAAVEAGLNAGEELIKPFASEQLFMGTAIDVWRNQKARGGEVYNPTDDWPTFALKVGLHLGNAFMPGIGTSAVRIGKAAKGYVEESGRSYDLLSEIAALIIGRVQKYDTDQSFRYQVSRFNRNRQNASRLFSKIFTSEGTVENGDVTNAYNAANKAEKEVIRDLHEDYQAAIKLGVPSKKASEIMKSGKIGEGSIKQARSGVYKRFTPGDAILKEIKASHPERYQEFLKAYGAAPKIEPL